MSDGTKASGWGKGALSDEHLVMKHDGLVVRARAVRNISRNVKLEDLEALRSEPHDPTGTMKQDAGILRCEIETADLDVEAPKPRSLRIDTDVVNKFGPTSGCEKCRKIVNRDPLMLHILIV